MTRILIVEDEPAYLEALEVALGQEGFETELAPDGRAGLGAFRASEPDLVLLDLMLPGVSGLDVLRSIRVVSTVPVIVVSAKDAESDVVAALELGADDYLRKPYSVRELVARIRVALRRPISDEAGSDVLEVGSATLDIGRYQLSVGETVFDLPRKEFEVMEMLMNHAGNVVTRDELLSDVWGITWSDSKTLDQHIRRLRRKLETTEGAPGIATIRGVGYRLEP